MKSPSILLHNDIYYVTFRARLKPQKAPKISDCWEYRCVQNYLYLKKYNLSFVSKGTGQIIGVPTPQGKNKNLNGSHDARLFKMNGGIYALMAVSYGGGWMSIIWDFQSNRPYVPTFQKHIVLKGKNTFEKNWCPLVTNNTLYILRNMDPLQILKCENLSRCTFYVNDTDALTFRLDDKKCPLRGETGFLEYEYPYYIGIGHTTNLRATSRFYRAHIVVLSVEREFRVVYVSDPIQVNSKVFKLFAGSEFWSVVENNFIFPVGLVLENRDSILLGAHVNDQGSGLFRIQGLKSLLSKVIDTDRKRDIKLHIKNDAYYLQKYLKERIIGLEVRNFKIYFKYLGHILGTGGESMNPGVLTHNFSN